MINTKDVKLNVCERNCFLNGMSKVPISSPDLIFQCLVTSLEYKDVGVSHVIGSQNHVQKVTDFLILVWQTGTGKTIQEDILGFHCCH